MKKRGFPRRNRTTAHTLLLKQAIVASFALPCDEALRRLSEFSEDDWQSAMCWLDISGMAIYFLNRIQQLSADTVPPAIRRSLDQRLSANRVRTRALQEEASTLAEWFNAYQMPYALLKGITLVPDSVPESVLRSQTDLDFLVAQSSSEPAIELIRRLGYRLYARSAHTLEFRAGAATLPDTRNIYSVRTQRALELHIAPQGSAQAQLLGRRAFRCIDGTVIGSLAGSDIFVQQGMHLMKHCCGEHTRLSWVLEFWRHAKNRSADARFWSHAEHAAASEPYGNLAMAIAFWIGDSMFGPMRETLPLQWTVASIPPRVRIWLERYAHQLLLSDTIGNKLYALLRNEINEHPETTSCTRKILFPLYLPKAITEPQPNEGLSGRLHRYVIELDFFIRRLHFHLAQGIRFTIETIRWRKAIAQCD